MSASSATVRDMLASLEPVMWFMSQSTYVSEGSKPGACDFCFGNPQEMPMPEILEALSKWAEPRNKDWYAYKFSVAETVAAAVESLRARHGIDFEPADVSMTTGAFGGLASSLRAVVDPGDEVIYLSPPWFFYTPMIISLGAKPIRVDLAPPAFSLPLEAIEKAVTSRTRAIIINSPHNPSGSIAQPDELKRLAAILETATRRNGRPIYLLSDESYCRILFDGAKFSSPLHYYDRSFLLYTYGKTLLMPGQRIGYIAMPPSMPDREELRPALFVSQASTGYAFPNAVMQYALGDLEKLSIDVGALERRRDRIVSALRQMGYEVVNPAATFYILVRSPLEDDLVFIELLAKERVFVMPGKMFELPGWFRISVTANDDMVERSLPAFARAREAALGRV